MAEPGVASPPESPRPPQSDGERREGPAPTLKRVGRHTLVYAVGILLGRLAAFILLPLYTHFLTPADYGVMQLVELTLDVVAVLAGSQMANGVFRFYHKATTDAERRAVLSTAAALFAASFGIFAALTVGLAPWLSEWVFGSAQYATLLRIAAASLLLQAFIIVPVAHLRLQEKSLHVTYIGIAKLVLQLGLNITFVAVVQLGVKGIFLSTLITNAVLAALLSAPFLKEIGMRWSATWARALLRYGIPLIGVNMATFIATFGDRYFLRAAGDMHAVGLYALAYQFGFLLVALGYMPFSLIWEPLRFEVAKRADRDLVFARGFLYVNILLLSMGVGISIFVGDFLRVMASPAFFAAAAIVPIIVAAYVLQGWTSFQEIGLLVSERTELVTLTNWICAITALVGYAVLIPKWQGAGAAAATFLAFLARYALTYVLSQRLWPVRYVWPPVLRLCVLAVGFCVANTVLPDLPLLWSVAMHVALFAAYLLALWNAKVLSDEDRRRVIAAIVAPRRAAATLFA